MFECFQVLLPYTYSLLLPTIYYTIVNAGNLLNRTLGLLKKNCNATVLFDSASIPENNSLRKVTTESVWCYFCLPPGMYCLAVIEYVNPK